MSTLVFLPAVLLLMAASWVVLAHLTPHPDDTEGQD